MSLGIVTLLVIKWEPQTRCFRPNRGQKTRKSQKCDILCHLLYMNFTHTSVLLILYNSLSLNYRRSHAVHNSSAKCSHSSQPQKASLTRISLLISKDVLLLYNHTSLGAHWLASQALYMYVKFLDHKYKNFC